jgi:LmbE family N-acetylglucosaminyl deacetylase
MRGALLDLGEPPGRAVLIGCHPDDIEIGCGATLLTLLARAPQLELTWVVLSANGTRADEARASAERFAESGTTRPEIVVESFRDGFFPYIGGEIKERLEELKSRIDPDIVFTHVGIDLHQDHRLVSELTWNTFRDNLVLEFEIPKYDADLASPNVFVPVTEEAVRRKVELLLECFPSQSSKHWFSEDVFRGLMRLRGVESNSPTRFAEGFRCRKLLLAL